jgi:hypothetical protein
MFLNKIRDIPTVRQTRPITMLPHTTKYLEECLRIGLNDLAERRPLLFKDQYGFKKGVSNLSAHYDFLQKARRVTTN